MPKIYTYVISQLKWKRTGTFGHCFIQTVILSLVHLRQYCCYLFSFSSDTIFSGVATVAVYNVKPLFLNGRARLAQWYQAHLQGDQSGFDS